MKLILLGPPGAGKGTQAEKLAAAAGIPTLSTGHILRAAVAEKLPVGLEAKSYMDSGALVPDDIIIRVVKEYLSKDEFKYGYILDGMPRTMTQAQMLDEMGVVFDAAVLLDLSDAVIEKRMADRRVCPSCGCAYSLSSLPPKTEGICDKCGSELEFRVDDKPETVRARLKTYHEATEPIIGYYREKGILRTVDADQSVADTTNALTALLGLNLSE